MVGTMLVYLNALETQTDSVFCQCAPEAAPASRASAALIDGLLGQLHSSLHMRHVAQMRLTNVARQHTVHIAPTCVARGA
jgi:hypothetical protein